VRVVILGTRGFPNIQGGIENHCEQLSGELAKLGCEVIVLTRSPYVDPRLREHNGVRLISVPTVRIKGVEAFLHTFLGVLRARSLRPDILHLHGIGPAVFTPLARLLGMKVVVTSHGPDYVRQKWNRFERFFLRFCERTAVASCNALIAVSGWIADGIRELYGRTAVVIPNGVRIVPPAQTIGALDRFGLRKGRYLLAVGRLVPEKGFHDLLRAFRELDLPCVKLVIAGEADHRSAYAANLFKEGTKSGNIVFTGTLTGLPLHELYSHAGLFVLPSYHEGLPIVLLEALSIGLKCVVSSIPANRVVEFAEDRVFAPGDVNGLKEKIRINMGGDRLPREREAVIGKIRQEYNWGKIAARTLELYRGLTGS
jgi:glycosyltransferase involved in cell wall biosynthesis